MKDVTEIEAIVDEIGIAKTLDLLMQVCDKKAKSTDNDEVYEKWTDLASSLCSLADDAEF